VLPPYYFRPVPAHGLRVFYERVLAATRHPVVVYHIPKYAVPVPAELVTSLPVWGVKDSGGEAGYAEAVHAAGKGVLVGTEDDLPARLLTAHGSISALANIVPEQVVALYRHVRDGRSAEAAALSAHRNGGEVTECSVVGLDVSVTVHVDTPRVVGLVWSVPADARAGPGSG